MVASPASSVELLTALAKRQVDFLLEPSISSLFAHHPNDITEHSHDVLSGSQSEVQTDDNPFASSPWWSWASEEPERWFNIIKNNIQLHSNEITTCTENIIPTHQCPSDVVNLLLGLRSISIPRFAESVILRPDGASLSKDTDNSLPSHLPAENIPLAKKPVGMSPKKIHEVSRMTSYISRLIEAIRKEHGFSVSHIVDIGAGQGYLSRALRDMKHDVHVLALDSVDDQTSGAQRRQRRSEKKNKATMSGGSVTHRTLQLGYDLRNDRDLKGAPVDENSSQMALEVVVDEWLGDLQNIADADINQSPSQHDRHSSEPTPVFFVALHACGSLTPTILRQVASFKNKSSSREWYCAAAVVVGCCYNLLERSDFPLSIAIEEHISTSPSSLKMSMNHLQLAAQVPLQWLRSEEAFADFKLALKKMSYRALLSVFLQDMRTQLDPTGASDNAAERRHVGKLNDNAYTDFDTFLAAAGTKLDFNFADLRRTRYPDIENSRFVRQLETLHVLRCILGPAVESLIVVDRLCWLMEAVGDELEVELVNLFDQGTSSGRNLAIVVRPR